MYQDQPPTGNFVVTLRRWEKKKLNIHRYGRTKTRYSPLFSTQRSRQKVILFFVLSIREDEELGAQTSRPLGDDPFLEHRDGGRRSAADRPDVRTIIKTELELDQILLIWHLSSPIHPQPRTLTGKQTTHWFIHSPARKKKKSHRDHKDELCTSRSRIEERRQSKAEITKSQERNRSVSVEQQQGFLERLREEEKAKLPKPNCKL